MRFDITVGWFIGSIGAGAVALLVATVATWRWSKLAGALGAVVTATVAVVAVLAGVNSYFAYYPTFGDLLGETKDHVSVASIASHLGDAPAPGATPTVTTMPKSGSVVDMAIPPATSHFSARDATIYLPPIWFSSPRPSLPVIELLHGTPGAPPDWARGGGVPEIADAWAARHDGWAPIFVLPDPNGSMLADTECVDGKQGRAETYLTVDVRTFAVERLGAAPGPSAWMVGGLSEGGYCGAMLAMRHPDLFEGFLDFGGDDRPTHTGGAAAIFSGSPQAVADSVRAYSLRTLLADRRTHRLQGWITVGQDDPHVAHASRAFADAASAAGLSVRFVLLSGANHTFHTWRQCLADAFPDVASAIGSPVRS